MSATPVDKIKWKIKTFAQYPKARDCSTRLSILRHLPLSLYTSRDPEEILKFQHASASQVLDGQREIAGSCLYTADICSLECHS